MRQNVLQENCQCVCVCVCVWERDWKGREWEKKSLPLKMSLHTKILKHNEKYFLERQRKKTDIKDIYYKWNQLCEAI